MDAVFSFSLSLHITSLEYFCNQPLLSLHDSLLMENWNCLGF